MCSQLYTHRCPPEHYLATTLALWDRQTARFHSQIGNTNFPGPTGPAQCHTVGLSED